MPVTLYTRIRERHQHNTPDLAALPTRDIEATGETYEAARAGLEAQVPEGWLMLGISTWAPGERDPLSPA